MPITDQQLYDLEQMALQMRIQIVRMMGAKKVHHFGGSLSSTDLIAALYFYKMRYDAANPAWPERDRFILSKGHSVPAQYVALALKGVFPLDELATLKKLGSRLQGHPAMHYTPGLEGCTGALGEGLSFCNGLALAGRVKGLDYRCYCIMGDGELQEGQVWEAAMTTSRRSLSNVTAIIDRNHLKAMDDVERTKWMEPLCERWQTFGWVVREVDGHNLREICDALDWASEPREAPAMIIAHTVKGKGVSIFEGQAKFHNAAITEEQLQQALGELTGEKG
jgi:transketolase